MDGSANRMLISQFHSRPIGKIPARQSGVVLIIALIVLVAMTLAGIALMRSVDTSNLIAGNLAFQQAATHSGDAGIEKAIDWLQTVNNGTTLNDSDPTNGYAADGSDPSRSPAAGQSWDSYWVASRVARPSKDLVADSSSNQVSYVIDRMCLTAAPKMEAKCTTSPVVNVALNNDEGPELPLTRASVVYYRITARIAGPRNTVSYVQAIVSM